MFPHCVNEKSCHSITIVRFLPFLNVNTIFGIFTWTFTYDITVFGINARTFTIIVMKTNNWKCTNYQFVAQRFDYCFEITKYRHYIIRTLWITLFINSILEKSRNKIHSKNSFVLSILFLDIRVIWTRSECLVEYLSFE